MVIITQGAGSLSVFRIGATGVPSIRRRDHRCDEFAASDDLPLRFAQLDNFAHFSLIEQRSNPLCHAVSGSNQRCIGASDVMSGRHATSSVPEQFRNRGVSVAFVSGEARECPPQVVAASVVQSRGIKESADLLFQISWTGTRPAWENQFVMQPRN